MPPPPKLLSTLAAPREPLTGGEDGEEKKGDNEFNPSVTARLLSLGLILKRGFPAFPRSKAPSGEAPGRYFIQGTPNFVLSSHTGVHIQAAVFMKEDLFCPIFTSRDCHARLHIRSDGVVLEESNSEDES